MNPVNFTDPRKRHASVLPVSHDRMAHGSQVGADLVGASREERYLKKRKRLIGGQRLITGKDPSCLPFL